MNRYFSTYKWPPVYGKIKESLIIKEMEIKWTINFNPNVKMSPINYNGYWFLPRTHQRGNTLDLISYVCRTDIRPGKRYQTPLSLS